MSLLRRRMMEEQEVKGAMEYVGQMQFESDSKGQIVINNLSIEQGYVYIFCNTATEHMMFAVRNPNNQNYCLGCFSRINGYPNNQWNNYEVDADGTISKTVNFSGNYGETNIYDVYRYKAAV